MQFESPGLRVLPLGGKPVVNAQPCNVARFEQGSGAEHIDKHIERSGKGQCVGHAHSVECAVARALGRVEVIVRST
jgi:hypothetical protein